VALNKNTIKNTATSNHVARNIKRNSGTFENNIHNIRKQHLQHQESIVTVERINIWNIETSRSTFAMFAHNTWNMLLKHLKHVEHLLATCTALGMRGRRMTSQEARRRGGARLRGAIGGARTWGAADSLSASVAPSPNNNSPAHPVSGTDNALDGRCEGRAPTLECKW
jgi:hypothetical protein